MRLVKWFIGIALVLVALALLLPMATKWYLVSWLEDKGYQAEIRRMSLNYFRAKLVVSGLDFKSAQGQRFSLGSAEADIDMGAAMLGRFELSLLKVSRLQADISRADGQLRVAGLSRDDIGTLLSEPNVFVRSGRFENIELCRAESTQCLNIEESYLSGLRLSHQGDWQLSHSGPLRLNKVFVNDSERDTPLLFAQQFQISSGSWSDTRVSLSGILCANCQLNELGTEQGQESFAQTQLGELKLQSFELELGNPMKLRLGKLEITSLRQSLENPKSWIDSTLNDNLAFWLPSLHQVLNRPAGQALQFSLTAAELSDGGLSWSDYRVSPAAAEQITQFKLVMGAIDSAAPLDATHVVASFRFGFDGLLKFEGDIFPLVDDFQFVGEGILQDLQLANFAGYSQSLLNADVRSGVVDVGFKLVYRDATLSGDTLWRITQLRMGKTGAEGARVPLSYSFDVLKDHNHSVPFGLSIAMNAEQGELNLSYLFSRIRETLVNKATSELGPAGALAVRAQGDMVFEPFIYATEARAPREEDKKRLEEVVKLLKDKEHLRMVFCPVTTGGEWAELFNGGQMPEPGTAIAPEQTKLLIQLAKTRGLMLQTLLVEKGIEARQIVICGPAVDMQQSGPSFIEASL